MTSQRPGRSLAASCGLALALLAPPSAAQYQTGPYGVPPAAAPGQGSFGGYPSQQPYPAQGGVPGQAPYAGQAPYQAPYQAPGQPPAQPPGGMMGGYPGAQQPYPPPGGMGGAYPGQAPYPGQGGVPGGQAGAGGDPQLDARMDAMMAEERRDFGVPAGRALYSGPMHAPTPNQIPGGQLVTTKGVHALVRGAGVPVLIFDVLGAGETLPNAIAAVPASQPGSFQDQTQQQFGQFLAQVTQGRTDTPLVFYCQGVQCWMSYNAALRAINLGYRNVLWYRGGLEAWKHAGLPTQQAQMQQQSGPPPQRPPARR